MNRIMLTLLMLAAGVAFSLLAQANGDEHEPGLAREANVIKAVGLMRFFHPHDAVEAVDWNAVLLEGFVLAEDADNDKAFAQSLTDLLGDLGAGIKISGSESEFSPFNGSTCGSYDPAVRWVHLGFGASPMAESSGIYSSRRSVSGVEESEEGEQFSTAMKHWPAPAWRERSLSLSAQARVVGEGQAALWARVDGPGGQTLFFDNMADRFIEGEEWTEHSIDFEVPEQAVSIMFGVMALESAQAEFRSVAMHDEEGATLLSTTSQWSLVAPQSGHEMEVEHEPDGFEIALLPRSPEPRLAAIDQYIPEDAPHQAMIELVDGSRLWVPLTLCQSGSELDDAQREMLADRFGAPDLEQLSPAELARLDVASLWPVVRHFYPYQELVDDWSGLLHAALESSIEVDDRKSHRRVLQRMLSVLKDSHINVIDRDESSQIEQALLPIDLQAVDGELVVAASQDTDRVQVGDRIVAVDGEPAAEWISDRLAHHSGPHHRNMWRAGFDLLRGPKGEKTTLKLARNDQRIEIELVHELDQLLAVRTGDPVDELVEGVVYIDLDRIEQPELDRALSDLDEPRALVFDLRGYPSGLQPGFLGRLMDREDDFEGWMRVLVAQGPNGDLVEGERFEWGLPAIEPRIQAPVVFLTDASAISYSESILGLVKYHGLGTIVGSNTAGANGNIQTVNLPGAFRVIYTAMRVIGPDGEPFQGRGIEPDVRVEPSVEGLREGRDEVLERALELLN